MTKPHWLAPGSQTWSPDVIISFDTETTEIPEEEQLRNIFLCWDAVVRIRHGAHHGRARQTTYAGEEPGQIADLIESWSEQEKSLWVFAHNLGFDLTVSQLPAILAARKWTIEAYGMSKESNWWILKRDGCKLVIADSWSWLPDSLASCARDIGKRKVPLPGTGEALALFHKRCKQDALILADLMCTVMDWWDAEKLGRWSVTGAGCGWQAMRTKTGAKKIVVGPDETKTAFERQAVFGGRKEVFRVGEIKGEWCADYDFQGAYPTIAAHHRLPVTPGVFHKKIPEAIELRDSVTEDYIAECVVTTERPCVPVRIDHEVWWPTGTFRTVLAGPEVAYARSVGATVNVGAGYVYRMDFALRDWAVWCLGLLHAPASQVSPLVRRMAKGWSRSVIGRFAGHTSQITSIRPAIGVGVRLTTGHNLDTGRPMEVLTIGDLEITTEHDLDGHECFPAVLAFVESYCRVALGQMLDSRHHSRVLQVNTDGWWERRVVRDAAYQVENVPWPHVVVRKACVNAVLILGPDHLVTPLERRMAGIPKNAEDGGSDRWAWHDWPGMRWQWERGANGEYLRPKRDLQTKASYARRWVLASGETVPVTTALDDNGLTILCTWSDTLGRRNKDKLAPYQDPRLEPLRSADSLAPVVFEGSGPSLFGRDLNPNRTVARTSLAPRRKSRRY